MSSIPKVEAGDSEVQHQPQLRNELEGSLSYLRPWFQERKRKKKKREGEGRDRERRKVKGRKWKEIWWEGRKTETGNDKRKCKPRNRSSADSNWWARAAHYETLVCLFVEKKIKIIKCCTQNKELCKLLISKITVLVKNTTSGGEWRAFDSQLYPSLSFGPKQMTSPLWVAPSTSIKCGY